MSDVSLDSEDSWDGFPNKAAVSLAVNDVKKILDAALTQRIKSIFLSMEEKKNLCGLTTSAKPLICILIKNDQLSQGKLLFVGNTARVVLILLVNLSNSA